MSFEKRGYEMKKEFVNWMKMVDYAIITATQIFKTGRYIYVIFMCHLVIEKIFKAASPSNF